MRQSSKNRLVPRHGQLFEGETLFCRIARAVCEAGVLPRKELYEAWETARRVRRRFRGGRVVDLACGHGLLAQILLILDPTSASALAVDSAIPKSAGPLAATLARTWPFLSDRLSFRSEDLDTVEIRADDLVVSAHACGRLTDQILGKAVQARARVAVLPCCHDLALCPDGSLSGWMDPCLAVDAVRAMNLQAQGYKVHTVCIPDAVTPKNRLLMGWPDSGGSSSEP